MHGSGPPRGGAVHLSVDDTPPTPPDDVLPRLFDRSSQAKASPSRALGGSVVGLPVCKVIAEARSGRITTAVSKLGGLNITFTLPEARK